ncbi:uncharacterized protein LOC109428770 [Aedes albopictus]|uniref:Secreted protein n=2 Tax=Aedes albopictus TaxID=7160 RepID=A0ABM1XPZ9_AEDAL
MYTIISRDCGSTTAVTATAQIAIGANLISAHRGQIRPGPANRTEHRRNIQLRLADMRTPRGTKRSFKDMEDIENSESEFPDLSEPDSVTPSPSISEVHPSVLQPTHSNSELRRSRRKKKSKMHEDFVYYS